MIFLAALHACVQKRRFGVQAQNVSCSEDSTHKYSRTILNDLVNQDGMHGCMAFKPGT